MQKAQQSASEGTASMQAAVAGFEGALATIGERVDAAIAQSLQELDRELSGTLEWACGDLPAWASQVRPISVLRGVFTAVLMSTHAAARA